MKRAPRTGTITPLPSGRFRARLRSGGAVIVDGVFDTAEECDRKLRAVLDELASEGAAPTGSMTLAQWAGEWFRERERDGFRSTSEERSCWTNRIAGTTIASLPLRAITRQHVRAWIEATRKRTVHRRTKTGRLIDTGEPLRISSLRRIRAVLRSCLQAAVERGHIDANPCAGIVIRAPSAAPRWTYLSRAEIERVITHDLVPAPFRWLYTVAIYSGLRRGELWALRWRDVTLDGDRPQVHVRGSHAGPTKTGRERIVPLLPPAVDALRKWREVTRWNEPQHHVFASATGARRAKADRAMWGRNGAHPGYRVVAGIARACSFHAFRHTCASALLQGYWGTPWRLEDVSLMLGHSSIAVTQRYAHLSSEYLHARARDLGTRDTGHETADFAANSDEIRPSSITTRGDSLRLGESMAIAPRRDLAVSFALAEALPLAVEQGVAVKDTIAALCASVEGIDELAPIARACVGPFRVRRALALAEAVIAYAAASVNPRRGVSR